MNTKLVILNKPNAEGKVNIYVQYNYKGRTLRISTQEKIISDDFDQIKQLIKKSDPNYQAINDSIQTARNKIESIIRNSRIQNVDPTVDYVSREFYKDDNKEVELKEQDKSKTLIDYINDWIDYSKKYKKTAKGIRLRHNTIKNYSGLIYHFTKYEQTRNITLSFDKIDAKFYDDYTNYLLDEIPHRRGGIGLSSNQVTDDIKLLKIFLKWAETEGLKVNQDYKNFKSSWKPVDIIILEWKEILHLNSLQLSKKLERIRDMLVVGCTTGMRISDILNLKKHNINFDKREINITAIKTDQTLTIPILDIAVPILKKYSKQSEERLFTITPQKFNDYLKELGQFAGLDKPIPRVIYKQGKRIDFTVPKYKLLTSHICRRTYITELLKRKVPSEIIMEASGHKDYKSFKKYVKLAREDVKSQIQHAFIQA